MLSSFSTPVYFGDRGSVAHDLIETIRSDPGLRDQLWGKVYAGISVGAKRNGGQETTLIYQLLEYNCYGDAGCGQTIPTPRPNMEALLMQGMWGRLVRMDMESILLWEQAGRLGHVATLLKNSDDARLEGPLRAQMWLLQDSEGKAMREVERIVDVFEAMSEPVVEVTLLDLTESEIHRCIACDICPTDVDRDEIYRCIIHKRTDAPKAKPQLIPRTRRDYRGGLQSCKQKSVGIQLSVASWNAPGICAGVITSFLMWWLPLWSSRS